MLHVVEVLQSFLAAKAFNSKVAAVSTGSSEQAVRQALGEASDMVVYAAEEDSPETVVWRYAHALGRRKDFKIGFVDGKWSHAWSSPLSCWAISA